MDRYISLIMLAILGLGGYEYYNRIQTNESISVPFNLMLTMSLLLFILSMAKRKRAVKLQNYDQVTGLYNKTFPEEVFPKIASLAERHQGTVALVVMDIKNFHKINERFGIDKGNYVLREVAETVKAVSRKGDIAFRCGLDEFAVILPFAQQAHVSCYCSRVRSSLSQLPIGIELNCVSASYPSDGQHLSALLLKAYADLKKLQSVSLHRIDEASGL